MDKSRPQRQTWAPRLRGKVLGAVGAMLLPLLLAVLTGHFFTKRTITQLERVVADSVELGQPLMRLQRLVLSAPIPVGDHLVAPSGNESIRFERVAREIETLFAYLRNEFTGWQRATGVLNEAYHEWQSARYLTEQLLLGHADEATAASEMAQRYARSADQLRVLDGMLNERISAYLENAAEDRNRLFGISALWFGLALVIALLVTYYLGRSILEPLRRLDEGARRIGLGDLDFRFPVRRRDEFGQLARTFNMMAEMLRFDREELHRLATHDELTGLHNKRSFLEHLQRQVKQGLRTDGSTALLLLDLDHFKRINDQYGHLSGDAALHQVAARIREVVREVDVAGRYGGEEFAVLLPDTDLGGAQTTAERIRHAIEAAPVELDEQGTAVGMTLSIGVAAAPRNSTDPVDLLRIADAALYAAKEAGRNRVCLPPE